VDGDLSAQWLETKTAVSEANDLAPHVNPLAAQQSTNQRNRFTDCARRLPRQDAQFTEA
jgi:hypothetical protein